MSAYAPELDQGAAAVLSTAAREKDNAPVTIAISLKINDGVVLAADSASTLIGVGPNGPQVITVYNNANKVFNLLKGVPIGALTWGQGAIGLASISTLMKDLRRRSLDIRPERN